MTGDIDPPSRPRVFLSHRYRSPAVNLFFWQIIRTVQPVAFRVDEGLTFTSPTRLERMIRDADGFVGIYPLPGDPQAIWDLAALKQQARYFLLELSIAARQQRPCIIFCDHRYGIVLRCPPEILVVEYDPQEIVEAEDSPLAARCTTAFTAFVHRLRVSIAARTGVRSYRRREVGLMLDPGTRVELGATLEGSLENAVWQPVYTPWPPKLELSFISRLRELDWVVIPLDSALSYVVASFALGHGVPCLLLARESAEEAVDDLFQSTIGSIEPHHPRRVLSWAEPADLEKSFEDTLEVIGRQPRLIIDADQAIRYFTAAARRKEMVFLSYAHEDGRVAEVFNRELSGKFQEVFDYRKNGSIRTGQNWLDELMDSLAKTAVGVLLLSPDYVASPYCLTEAQRLFQASIEGRVTLLPVRLRHLELPEFLKGVQYRRLGADLEVDVEAVVSELIELLGEPE
ncbi:toll/interleukin-1 receptor domain-containing protein [Nocardia rhizosphaerihabitans]|uniref:TIR domain-containing protein n=1 Tax=Nocardia rhizosphaerihabitans TaxID=1691570 RepID=A0ABQ2K5E8_9NOCA|nr:toll/interleukin-1 receptor domain-containing protein [Nocardia rhizosphaerihabitans]GGN67913.1 hypothetical protein GCM10011610_04660 [Nocardia rhizosphaerihabitans]